MLDAKIRRSLACNRDTYVLNISKGYELSRYVGIEEDTRFLGTDAATRSMKYVSLVVATEISRNSAKSSSWSRNPMIFFSKIRSWIWEVELAKCIKTELGSLSVPTHCRTMRAKDSREECLKSEKDAWGVHEDTVSTLSIVSFFF